MQPHGDVPNPGPRVEPRTQSMEGAVVRGQRAPGESECRNEQSAALVEHGLLDDLIRPLQYRLRDREPERFGGLEVNH
jgi:hypothetical protein